MAVLASDLFNRANESPLAAPWTEAGTGNTLRLVSNAVAATTASTDCVYYYSGPTWPADQYSQVICATIAGAGDFDAGPCVRIQPGGGGDYYIFNLASFIFHIYKVTNLGFSDLVNVVTGGITAGDVMYLEAKTSGGNCVLIAKVNGVQVLTFTDTSSPFGSGSAGIGMFGGTERIDGFEAGDFVTVPVITAQPVGSAAVVGATTQYSVTATGVTTYQWQYSTNGGETWASASGGSGADTATYTTATTVVGMNGWKYRCSLTNANGTAYTVDVYFHVSGMPNTGRGRRLPTSGWFARTENKGGLRTGANPNLLRKNSVRTAGEGYDTDFASAWADWFIAPAPTLPDALRIPLPIVGTNRNRPGRGPYSTGKYFRRDTRFFGNPVTGGAIAGTSDIVITPTGTILGAGALAGTAALQFGAGSSAITGAGALLGTAGIAITPTGAITGAGALAGSSAITLTPTAALLGAGALVGSSALVFTPAATMAGAGSLAGSSAIVFTPTATVAGAGALAGTSAIVFTPAATLAGVGTLAGSIAIAFTPTGSVVGAGSLAGSSALVFGGSLTADDSIAGVASLVFTPTATLQGAGELAGTSALVFDASASMLGAGELVGSSALVFGGAATLQGVGELTGSAAIQFTPEGVLDGAGVGEMAGTASLVFDGAGLFTGVGALAGTAASTLLASGNLTFTGGTDLAAEVWNYVLNNGKTAEQNMLDILNDVELLLSRSCTDENVQAGYNVGDAFRILLAVAAGKSRIDSLGGGAAHVEFDAIDDSGVVVAADMQGSERVDVTLTPEETS